jgi:hypothetical protein
MKKKVSCPCTIHDLSMVVCLRVGAPLPWMVVLVCPLGGPLGELHGLFGILEKR